MKPRETDRDLFKELFGPKMIKLPAGTMKIIGKNKDQIKEVAFPSFSISKYEITFKEYDLFAIANNHELPETEKQFEIIKGNVRCKPNNRIGTDISRFF